MWSYLISEKHFEVSFHYTDVESEAQVSLDGKGQSQDWNPDLTNSKAHLV